jgi:hypothetical protein
MRLLTLDATQLFDAISRQASNTRHAIETKDERKSRRRQECDGGATSNDQDATALGRCEELAGSPPKIVTPMRSMATDRGEIDGIDGDRAFCKMTTNYLG